MTKKNNEPPALYKRNAGCTAEIEHFLFLINIAVGGQLFAPKSRTTLILDRWR